MLCGTVLLVHKNPQRPIIMPITVKCSNEANLSIEFNEADTVLDLKNKIKDKAGDDPTTQRLIFAGRVLKDADPISTYKITNDSTIHLVRARKPASDAPAERSTPASTGPTPQQAPTPAPLPQMFGAGTGGMPDMSSMMNNPAFQQMMSSMMSNPAFLDSIQPGLSQQITPEMRAMMSNPAFMQMMMRPEMIQMASQMRGAGGNPGQVPSMPGLMDPAMMNPAMLQNLLGGLGAPAAAQTPSGPPEEVYQTQLSQLRDMGFYGNCNLLI